MYDTYVRPRNKLQPHQGSDGFLGRGLTSTCNGLSPCNTLSNIVKSSCSFHKSDPLKFTKASPFLAHKVPPPSILKPTIVLPFMTIAPYPKPRSPHTPRLSHMPLTLSKSLLTEVSTKFTNPFYISEAGTRIFYPLIEMKRLPSQENAKSSAETTPEPSLPAYKVESKPKPKTKKKYKPVAKKVRAVMSELPDKFRIVRNIVGDPLASLPTLMPLPPDFKPIGRYTQERKDIIDQNNAGFLLDEERKLLHHFMTLHQDAFAWNDTERGHFREDFFPPVEIPVVPHTPWVQKNIPIPPGLYDEVCEVLQRKIDAGVFEPSNSSYLSRWFCVVKKDGKSLRIVQSLEPLNEVTIRHSGVPPFTEQLIEHFSGRACGSTLDLFVGYDERALAKSSRDYTTFQTPFGAMRLTTLPMGWANSVPIFHDDVTHILRPEIPKVTEPFLDDVPVRGPATRYLLPTGEEERIPQNSGIRRFVWEHFQDLNRICQRMKYSGGTFSGFKAFICRAEIDLLGNRCTINGRLPDEGRVTKVTNWGPCNDLSDIRAFIGTIGTCRMFIRNFASRAHHLVKLTRKGAEWEFGEDQLAAMADLKDALINSPALRPIDYTSDAPVILSVDTSYIAIGYLLAQCDVNDPKIRYYARFGSITLNEREARFSQPKLELYGLYRSLRALKNLLIGVRNMIVEVDASYIKGMLKNPDISPSASMNRWILSILMFHFTLIHVPGSHHGPDGLSRRRPQPEDTDEPEDDFEDWIDQVNGFMHFINPTPSRAMLEHGTVTAPPIACYVIGPARETSEAPEPPTKPSLAYKDVPRSELAKTADAKLDLVKMWHETLEWPGDPMALTDGEYKSFMRYATEFFVSDEGRLWRKDAKGNHKVVVSKERRLFLITSAHDDVGHHGFYATHALLAERYWWPQMAQGLYGLVTYVSLGKLGTSLFHQPSLRPHPYSRRFTWTRCTCLHPPDTNISFKDVARLHIGRNGKCYERKPRRHWLISSYIR